MQILMTWSPFIWQSIKKEDSFSEINCFDKWNFYCGTKGVSYTWNITVLPIKGKNLHECIGSTSRISSQIINEIQENTKINLKSIIRNNCNTSIISILLKDGSYQSESCI